MQSGEMWLMWPTEYIQFLSKIFLYLTKSFLRLHILLEIIITYNNNCIYVCIYVSFHQISVGWTIGLQGKTICLGRQIRRPSLPRSRAVMSHPFSIVPTRSNLLTTDNLCKYIFFCLSTTTVYRGSWRFR